MAVNHSAAVSPAKTTKKRKKTEQEEEVKPQMVPDLSNPNQDSDLENSKQPKRTKSPGVRVVGSRVYDSSNGKSCHQCRQKTLDFSADCKHMKNDKQCTMKWCHKCLLNRYGEKAEEVALLDDWKCPKCRGICNCSCCMKKRGCQPTGILIHNAKASGFSSVSELLHVQSPKSLSQAEMAESKSDTVASPKKTGKENICDGALNKISETPSKKGKKVKYITEKIDVNGVKNASTGTNVVKEMKNGPSELKSDEIINDVSEVKNETDKMPTGTSQVNKAKNKNSTKMKKVNEFKESTEICEIGKAKFKELAEVCDIERGNHSLTNVNESVVPEDLINVSTGTNVVRKIRNGPSELKIDKRIKNVSDVKNETDQMSTGTSQVNKAKRKNYAEMKNINGVKESTEICETEKGKFKELAEVCDAERGNHALSDANESVVPEEALKKKATLHPNDRDVPSEKPKEVIIILPSGNELTNVAELDLPPEDVGNVLQLIEFCYTFGEVLKIRKGQIESVLRDMRLGRNRRGKVSSVVQFNIQLLTLIQEDMDEEFPLSPTDGKDCWLHALKECVSESAYVAKDLAALDFDRTDKYDMLSSSDKLKLLIFLCDEILMTLQVRNWMDEENLKFSEKKKEAKIKMLAAKEKTKLAKRKLQDEVAKAVIAKEGVPLSIAEHEALVSEMKAATELAHAEMLETRALLPNDDCALDALRIKPVLIDSEGYVCWRLMGCKKSEFLRQEIQYRDDSKASDKWFGYNEEKDVQVINEYISGSRSACRIRRRKDKMKTAPKVENGNLNPQTDLNQFID